MNLAEVEQNGDCTGNVSSVQLLSLDSSDSNDIFGEPEISPRIGDQYQAQVPSLLAQPTYFSYMENPFDAKNTIGAPFNFLVGFPIPISWIDRQAVNLQHKKLELLGDSDSASGKGGILEPDSVRAYEISLKDGILQDNDEVTDVLKKNVIGTGEFSQPALEDKHHHLKCLVPDCIAYPYTEIEKESFLLGLYIFEKNFFQIKRFMEHKKMGDILSYYYGKFYRSPEYCRWSECRKKRSKRYMFGQRIFNGLRQQELLSRLAQRVSEECQNALSEVFKTYGEGKMSLEEFVSSLKSMVGITNLVETVGIGKGKQDLTCITMEPPRSNQPTFVHSEIPTGKACSSLTPQEIIKFLTGGYRLSKARSSDLFWEAVWPRLLARGWNSLEPKGQNYAAVTSKQSLVFLVPGVKKFSRRKLVKGNQYFDSISDLLSKVASEPGLLEDVEENGINGSKEESSWNNETKLERDTSPDRQRRCYLQPRIPNRNTNIMKFTIVDTSLSDGKPFRLRELRALPFEMSRTFTSRSISEDSDEDEDTDVSTDESDIADAMLFDEKETNDDKPRITFEEMGLPDKKKIEFSELKLEMATSCPDPTDVGVSDANDHDYQEEQWTKSLSCHFNHKLKQDNLDYVAPAAKRRKKLTCYSNSDTRHNVISFPVVHGFKQEMNPSNSDISDVIENNVSQVGSSQDKLSSSSSKDGLTDRIEDFTSVQCPVVEHVAEKPQLRALIDLNEPQIPLDSENGVFMAGPNNEQGDCIINVTDDPCKLKPSENAQTFMQQPSIISQRHSTRNRPPTIRALEALANGFLTVNRRPKNKGTSTREKKRSRPFLLAHNSLDINGGQRDVTPQLEEDTNGPCNDKSRNMFCKFPVVSEENGT